MAELPKDHRAVALDELAAAAEHVYLVALAIHLHESNWFQEIQVVQADHGNGRSRLRAKNDGGVASPGFCVWHAHFGGFGTQRDRLHGHHVAKAVAVDVAT
jgi:hypothetical protein